MVVEVWTTENLHSGLCCKYRVLGKTGGLLSSRVLLWGSHGEAVFTDLAAAVGRGRCPSRAAYTVDQSPHLLHSLQPSRILLCGVPLSPQESHCSFPHISASTPIREDLASGFKVM